VNLAYRWFCGLSIEDKIPDHSAFSRARNERFRDSDIFRRMFERRGSAHFGRCQRAVRLPMSCPPC
jgi:transposase